jgi:hypothetical protein
VEYILILIVVVGIIGGVVFKMNDAFKVWANNYFGEYLACLLETGELPNTGGSGDGTGICETSFKPFSITEGKPLIKGGTGGTGKVVPGDDGTGGSGKGGSKSASDDSGSGGRGSRGADNDSSANGRGGGAGNRSRIGAMGSRRGFNANSTRIRGRGEGDKEENAYTGSTEAGDYGAGGAGGRGKRKGSARQRLDTRFATDTDKEEVPKRTAILTSEKKASDSPKKNALKNKEKKLKRDTASDDDSGFSFGDFIRWLIIIALILMLILTLGGQFVQMNNAE